MKAKGKIVREPGVDPGLLMVDGRQIPFSFHRVWRSQIRPTRGLEVEVEFDKNQQLIAVTTTPEPSVTHEGLFRRILSRLLGRVLPCLALLSIVSLPGIVSV